MCAVDLLVDEAMNMCDRIATLDKRETMRIPTPLDIYGRPSLLGNPPIAYPEASAGPGGTWLRATGADLGRLEPGTSVDCWTGSIGLLAFNMDGAQL
jgi:inositol-phosphate transport system ATP-binding protein